MVKQIAVGLVVLAVTVIVVVVLLHRPLIRPWYMRWGATDAETTSALAGDDLVSGEGVSQSTRAVGIHAPV